jgi:hypothetical protein
MPLTEWLGNHVDGQFKVTAKERLETTALNKPMHTVEHF